VDVQHFYQSEISVESIHISGSPTLLAKKHRRQLLKH